MNVFFISIVVASVNPWMLLPTIIMLTVFYFLRVVFLATSRNIKRLEGISKQLEKRSWVTNCCSNCGVLQREALYIPT